MPYLLCTNCKEQMEIQTCRLDSQEHKRKCNPMRLIGSAICRKCGIGTGFELENDTVVYVSGKSSYGSLNAQLSETTKTFYAEAELCFQNGSPNAATAMCRASLEAALNQSGFDEPNLYTQINSAKEAGKLDDVEVGLAHGSRLITNSAIHGDELIHLSDVPSILSVTVRLLNKLASPAA